MHFLSLSLHKIIKKTFVHCLNYKNLILPNSGFHNFTHSTNTSINVVLMLSFLKGASGLSWTLIYVPVVTDFSNQLVSSVAKLQATPGTNTWHAVLRLKVLKGLECKGKIWVCLACGQSQPGLPLVSWVQLWKPPSTTRCGPDNQCITGLQQHLFRSLHWTTGQIGGKF